MLDEIFKSRWKIPIKINPRKIKTIKLSGTINISGIFEVLNNKQVNVENFISTKTNEMYKFRLVILTKINFAFQNVPKLDQWFRWNFKF